MKRIPTDSDPMRSRRVPLEHVVLAVATAGTVIGAVAEQGWLQRIFKPLIGPSLAVGVVRRGRRGVDLGSIVGGLAAATVGDILLIDPDDDRNLVRGATSFAVMQSAYSATFLRNGAAPTTSAAVPRVLGLSGFIALLAAREPNVAVPLGGYGITLGKATTLASDPALAPGARLVAGLPVPNADPRSRLALGALLFNISDALIIVRRVMIGNEGGRRAAEGVILATYAAAQYCLVEGMLALSADQSQATDDQDTVASVSP